MFVSQMLIRYLIQMNVLIDDNEKAVLCDFGLSQVKADATSRTAILGDATPVAGSRNWMAPERLMGGSLRRPCDIYAFGIMIPEVWFVCFTEKQAGLHDNLRFIPTRLLLAILSTSLNLSCSEISGQNGRTTTRHLIYLTQFGPSRSNAG